MGVVQQSLSGAVADTPDAPREKGETSHHEPTIIDVLVVKAMLVKALHLPPEIVDNIVDQAEYWPHTTAEVNYGSGTDEFTIGRETENEFLLRTAPLGFPKWPSQIPLPQGVDNAHRAPAQPRQAGQPFPPVAFQPLIGAPTDTVTHPCRKIVFTIRSHDQGWGGNNNDNGTYNSSWTWFEAGLERWSPETATPNNPEQPQGEGEPTQDQNQQAPSLNLDNLATVYPSVREIDGAPGFHHPLHPIEQLKIQCNITVDRDTQEHKVVWSRNDDVNPNDTERAEKLAQIGRGRATGDGKFVRELQLGDIVTVWGKARFPGWTNHVESVKVDVYWSI